MLEPDAYYILQRADGPIRREIARLLHVPFRSVRRWKGGRMNSACPWRNRQIEALVELKLITLPPWLH